MTRRVLEIVNMLGMIVCSVMIYVIWQNGFHGYALALGTALTLLKVTRWIRRSQVKQLSLVRSYIQEMTPGERIQTFGVLVFVSGVSLSEPPQIIWVATVTFVSLFLYAVYQRRRHAP